MHLHRRGEEEKKGGGGVGAHLAVLAPCLMSAVMISSWPCRAAVWRAVFLSLSSQSMSAPAHTTTCNYMLDTTARPYFEQKNKQTQNDAQWQRFDQQENKKGYARGQAFSPFWIRAWEQENLPWVAAMWRGVLLSLLWADGVKGGEEKIKSYLSTFANLTFTWIARLLCLNLPDWIYISWEVTVIIPTSCLPDCHGNRKDHRLDSVDLI